LKSLVLPAKISIYGFFFFLQKKARFAFADLGDVYFNGQYFCDDNEVDYDALYDVSKIE